MVTSTVYAWLLAAEEPWTRYRTLVDLLERPASDPEVLAARQEMLAHPRVQGLMAQAGERIERPITRHNEAAHPIHKLSVLADFGVRASDPGMQPLIEDILARQSSEGAYLSLLNIAKAFGGSGEDQWSWILCDAPVLLYCLLAFGLGNDPRVQRASEHLASLVEENGWHCTAAPELGKFRGPGRKTDPCPVANLYALQALSLAPDYLESPAAQTGAQALLHHWESQAFSKPYLFGIGSDFRKLKYPLIWYDILHAVEALSRFAFVHSDARFQEMVRAIAAQADEHGRYTATSMYQAWKGWSFADKKVPSPWLTFLALRMLKSCYGGDNPPID